MLPEEELVGQRELVGFTAVIEGHIVGPVVRLALLVVPAYLMVTEPCLGLVVRVSGGDHGDGHDTKGCPGRP